MIRRHTDDVQDLIERSSLGTLGAKQLRARTPATVVERILARSRSVITEPSGTLQEAEPSRTEHVPNQRKVLAGQAQQPPRRWTVPEVVVAPSHGRVQQDALPAARLKWERDLLVHIAARSGIDTSEWTARCLIGTHQRVWDNVAQKSQQIFDWTACPYCSHRHGGDPWLARFFGRHEHSLDTKDDEAQIAVRDLSSSNLVVPRTKWLSASFIGRAAAGAGRRIRLLGRESRKSRLFSLWRIGEVEETGSGLWTPWSTLRLLDYGEIGSSIREDDPCSWTVRHPLIADVPRDLYSFGYVLIAAVQNEIADLTTQARKHTSFETHAWIDNETGRLSWSSTRSSDEWADEENDVTSSVWCESAFSVSRPALGFLTLVSGFRQQEIANFCGGQSGHDEYSSKAAKNVINRVYTELPRGNMDS